MRNCNEQISMPSYGKTYEYQAEKAKGAKDRLMNQFTR
jgi:hypothetical protein